jgi:FkbM family methyltransferase
MLLSQSSTIPQGPGKRLVLSALVGAYIWCGRLTLAWRCLLASAKRLFYYVRGVHLLVLEKISDPPVESLRLVALAAGGATFKMALATPGLIEDHIIRNACWEPQLMELMAVLIRPNSVFVDVGANIGFHSLHIAARNPETRCHAFEPHPEIFRQLTRNTLLSALKNVTLHHHALAGTRREGVFYLQDASAYNRGLSSSIPHSDLKNRWQEARVRFEPLDDVLSDLDRGAVSLIKIDTQGTEREVLAGAQRTVSEARPAILFEFESRYHADPAREIQAILSLLPKYEIFCLKPAIAEMRRFDVDDVKDGPFEGDLVCLPL